MAEIAMAREVWDRRGWGGRRVSTVFFGGGTPTLLPVGDLLAILDAVREACGLEAGAEVTVEANPDSVDEGYIARLAAGGVTRLSLGMQSAVPAVLRTLGRTHDRSHVPRAVEAARAAGMGVSVDLIYGTPGETLADWETSVRTAVGYGIGHLSAYALTLEPHTPLARRIARGEVAGVDLDDQANKYEVADSILRDAGFAWYEISNFARTPGDQSRHNLGYWRGGDWWGIGPGAHSGMGGEEPVRWWNVAHPRVYAGRLAAGLAPEAGREVLDAEGRAIEHVMLRLRLADGLAVADVPAGGRGAIGGLVADGLVDEAAVARGRVCLTLRGRLLADAVTRALIA
jgi:oxygen-independent coproporphyrinogen-3 oxidase